MSLAKEIYVGNPTVVPVRYFNATEDVADLRTAMRGFGTDESKLIAIICRRSNEQLQIIRADYKSQLDRDLYRDVRSETSGNFRSLLSALLKPRHMFYVRQLFAALDGLTTDKDALIEILCALRPDEKALVREGYLKKHKRSLDIDIITDTFGAFRRLLLGMWHVNRDDCVADLRRAHRDAEKLIHWHKGEDMKAMYTRILIRRSFSHIRAIDRECTKIGETGLLDLISKHFRGNFKNALLAIAMYAINRAGFFASRLHRSMFRLGTDDSQLIRVLVMRCEIDLADVDVNFGWIYEKSLASFIKGDTSGDYRSAMLALIRYS